jgi:hypothetical protein
MKFKVYAIATLVMFFLFAICLVGCPSEKTGVSTAKVIPGPGHTEPTYVPEAAVVPDETYINEYDFGVDYDNEVCAWHYGDWVNVEAFYDAYISFLEESVNEYENDLLNIPHYVKTLRVYTIVGETLIVDDDTELAKVVYDTGYHTLLAYEVDFEFDVEVVQNTIALLKEHRNSGSTFPFVSF